MPTTVTPFMKCSRIHTDGRMAALVNVRMVRESRATTNLAARGTGHAARGTRTGLARQGELPARRQHDRIE